MAPLFYWFSHSYIRITHNDPLTITVCTPDISVIIFHKTYIHQDISGEIHRKCFNILRIRMSFPSRLVPMNITRLCHQCNRSYTINVFDVVESRKKSLACGHCTSVLVDECELRRSTFTGSSSFCCAQGTASRTSKTPVPAIRHRYRGRLAGPHIPGCRYGQECSPLGSPCRSGLCRNELCRWVREPRGGSLTQNGSGGQAL
jgi:hypothetical protein